MNEINQQAHAPRIGFVLHAMQVAGAEVLVAEMVRRLGRRIEPTIICLDAVGPLGEQMQAEGVAVVALGRRPGRDWRVAARLRSLVKERRIELLHAHQYSPFFYAALAKGTLLRRPRLVFTEHGRHFPDVVSATRRGVNRLVLARLADAVTACSRFSAEALVAHDGFGGRSIEVIENGIDLARYTAPLDREELRRRLGLDANRRYVLCVARLHPVKDHATLLQAFARLARPRGDVELLLAGAGPLRADLEAQAAALNLVGRVTFLGVRSDVPDLLRAADVFVLTSVSEAASLTLLEALGAGLPVVATAVGGNPEIVRDDVEGLLVPRGDAEAAAAALGRLLDDPPLAARLGAAGRQRVQERFRLNTTIETYARLYGRLLGRVV